MVIDVCLFFYGPVFSSATYFRFLFVKLPFLSVAGLLRWRFLSRVEAWLRREEWSEDDRLSAVEAWLSAVNEGTYQDVIG